MAQMKSNIGGQAVSLAKLWGQKFGNTDFGRTLGEMKTLLKGNLELGLPAYRCSDIKECIEWLFAAQQERKLKKNINGPGVIRWIIGVYLNSGKIEDTFLCYEEPKRVVRVF